MQCSSCRAVYSNGLDLCPRCKTPAARTSSEPQLKSKRVAAAASESIEQPMTAGVHTEATAASTALVSESSATTATAANAPGSTLIEFPGAGRAARPQWRKELSERVREIQERRARDAEREAQDAARRKLDQPEPPAPAHDATATPLPPLGLVPQPDAPPLNPIVEAALRRIERARQTAPPMAARTRGGSSVAATAVARVAEEQYEDEPRPASLIAPAQAPLTSPAPAPQAQAGGAEKTLEAARERGLVVVQSQPATPIATAVAPAPSPSKPVQKNETNTQTEAVTKSVEVALKPHPKRVFAEPVDDAFLDRLEEAAPRTVEEQYDDRASVFKRLAGAFVDLLVVAFASTPFAAIIELTNGNWTDVRVQSAMGGIFLLVMFLYLAASTALTGRTWGMSLVSVRAVDAETGERPTMRQAIGRALLYMLSLATLGLGLLYALFDAEGRTLHDYLSRTAVVRE